MTLYHINKKGIPVICHAQPGKCPLHSEHYLTKDLAQEASDKINTENFVENNLFPESEINSFLKNDEDAFFFKNEPTNEVITALTDFTYYHYLYKDSQPEKYKARN